MITFETVERCFPNRGLLLKRKCLKIIIKKKKLITILFKILVNLQIKVHIFQSNLFLFKLSSPVYKYQKKTNKNETLTKNY